MNKKQLAAIAEHNHGILQHYSNKGIQAGILFSVLNHTGTRVTGNPNFNRTGFIEECNKAGYAVTILQDARMVVVMTAVAY